MTRSRSPSSPSKPYAHKLCATIGLQHAHADGRRSRNDERGHEHDALLRRRRAGERRRDDDDAQRAVRSGVYVPAAGFFLNNEMDDFAAQPGQPNMFGLVQGERTRSRPASGC